MAKNKTSEPPRDDLFRMNTQQLGVESREGDGGNGGDGDGDGDGEGNTLVGHLAVFGESTLIDSWEGRFEESIAPGAFTKTIRENGENFKVQFDHGFGDYSQPIAVPQVLREDDTGLYLEARFIDTDASRTVKELVRSGAVDGMSFRFSVIKDEWDHEAEPPQRTLTEVRLREGGPVTFPAYEATAAGVRGHAAFEQWRQGNKINITVSGGAPTATEIEDVVKSALEAEEPPPGTPDAEPPPGTRRNTKQPLLTREVRRFLDERP